MTIVPPEPANPVRSVEYSLHSDMRNYHKVIIPDSGRWYINMTQSVSFWRYKNDSAVGDVKLPIYVFTGQDHYMAMAFGIIGECYETSFRTLEPEANRALIAYSRRLSVQIKRGTDLYPIPPRVANRHVDGAVTEWIYFRTAADSPDQPWLLTIRDFCEAHKQLFGLPDVGSACSMAPLWCSWTDWFSDDVNDETILRSVREGLEIGIKNYIIDDGWFGPGLDNDFSVPLNIGDWRPDPREDRGHGQAGSGHQVPWGSATDLVCSPRRRGGRGLLRGSAAMPHRHE